MESKEHKKILREEIPIPFEVGKTYTTKVCLGEPFTITKIDTISRDKVVRITGFWGIYENNKHLGICPISVDRLIQPMKFSGVEIEVTKCPNCKHEF